MALDDVAPERRRLEQEGYFIHTDSDTEELYGEEEIVHPTISISPRAISVYGGAIRDNQGKPWPARWSYWCKHCCHFFDTAPIGIPVRYDDLRERYFCIEPCCSDSCAKARIIGHGWSVGPIGLHFSTMMRKAYGMGWGYRVSTAPPQSRLDVFGGDLTIEQFRTYGERFVCWKVPNNVLIETQQLAEISRVEQIRRHKKRERNIQAARGEVVLPHRPKPARKEPTYRKQYPPRLKMVREKPLPKKTHTLESFLGNR